MYELNDLSKVANQNDSSACCFGNKKNIGMFYIINIHILEGIMFSLLFSVLISKVTLNAETLG